jgi:glutaredoxin-related protein
MTDTEALIAELRAKLRRYSDPALPHLYVQANVNGLRAALDALEATRSRVGVLEGALRRIKAMQLTDAKPL